MCPAFALEFIFKHLAAGSFQILWEMASYVGIRGANGGRLRLEPRIARPPPRQKGPPHKDWSPPKDLWILGVEASQELCSSCFLSTLYRILSNSTKKLQLALHFLIYPYINNYQHLHRKNPVA